MILGWLVMPKYFNARKAEEIKKFLEVKGFKLVNHNGDDEIWATSTCNYTVKLPSRNETMQDGTMSHIKKCLRYCGIDPKEMLKWWKDNGYHE